MNLDRLTPDELERHLYCTAPGSVAQQLAAMRADSEEEYDQYTADLEAQADDADAGKRHAEMQLEDAEQRIERARDAIENLIGNVEDGRTNSRRNIIERLEALDSLLTD